MMVDNSDNKRNWSLVQENDQSLNKMNATYDKYDNQNTKLNSDFNSKLEKFKSKLETLKSKSQIKPTLKHH